MIQQNSFTLCGDNNLPRCAFFVRTSPIDFALLGRKRKYVKSKTTAKLKGKQTSIAAVWAKLGQIDTFQTPLLSHCRLPLTCKITQMHKKLQNRPFLYAKTSFYDHCDYHNVWKWDFKTKKLLTNRSHDPVSFTASHTNDVHCWL